LTLVLLPIGKEELSVTMLFIFLILANVLPIINPCKFSFAMHLVELPLPIVFASIVPLIKTLTVDVVVNELALVLRLVSPQELAFSVLLSVLVLSFVH
jgi:hypothetical protein